MERRNEMEMEIGILGEGGSVAIDSLLEFARTIQEEANPELAILREIQEDSDGKVIENKMDEFTRIVKGVARKYSIDNFGIEREDLEQDLWVKVFEVINANGGIESDSVNSRLIAKCCWNAAVDKYRYHRRRRDSKAEFDESSDENNSLNSNNSNLLHSRFRDGYDGIVIKEIIDLFPIGSRERKYVVTKLYMYGEIDEYDVDDVIEMPEDDREESILKILGYKSKYPASWGSTKNKMKHKIYEYLGRFEDYKSVDKIVGIKERIDRMFNETRNYWIYLSDIKKDEVIKMIGSTEEDILSAIRKTNKFAIAIDHKNNKIYIIRNEENYVRHIEKLGDRIIP